MKVITKLFQWPENRGDIAASCNLESYRKKKAEPFLTLPLLPSRLAFSSNDLYAGLLTINLTILP
jgi:hypothetical protein